MPTQHRTRTALRVGLFLVATMVAFAASSGLTPKTLGPAKDVVAISVAAAATFLLTLLFCRWDAISLREVGASFGRASILRFGLGFAIGSAMIAVDMLALHLLGHVRWQRLASHGVAGVALPCLLFFVVALREELAFRGYPLRRLDAAFGAWSAQIVIATIFALEHFGAGYSWSNALFGTFAGALLFGTAALVTRGLAVPIGIHLAWNLGDWMIGNKGTPGLWQPTAPTTQFVGLSAYLIAVAFSVLAVYVLRTRFSSSGR